MKAIILAGMVACYALHPCFDVESMTEMEGRPTGCITDREGKKFEYPGYLNDETRDRCGVQKTPLWWFGNIRGGSLSGSDCKFDSYNQAAPDDEFERERDICRPKPPCHDHCEPIS